MVTQTKLTDLVCHHTLTSSGRNCRPQDFHYQWTNIYCFNECQNFTNFYFCFSFRHNWRQITQAITTITKKEGNTAFLEWQIRDISRKNAYIHWYQQKPDQPLKRILYISSNDNVIHERGVSEERYEARKQQSNLLASLRIHQVKKADAGLYYCACWVEYTAWKCSLSLNKNPPMLCHLYRNTPFLLSATQTDMTTNWCTCLQGMCSEQGLS